MPAIFGPFACGLAAGAAGSFLGGGGNSSANDTQERFKGFSTTGGLFDAGLTKVKKGNDIVDFGINGPIGNLQDQLINSSTGLFGQSGNADIAGNLGAQFLNNVGSTDPLELQRALFSQISPQLIDQQQQDFLGLEGRLFGQGRLGSTGGSRDLGTLFSEQEDARQRLLFDTFGQAQAAQNQQTNLGMALSQLDPQLRGLFSGIGNEQLAAALGIQQAADANFRTGAQIGGASRIAELNSGGADVSGLFPQIGSGLMASGIDQIGSGVNNIFSPQARPDPLRFAGNNAGR